MKQEITKLLDFGAATTEAKAGKAALIFSTNGVTSFKSLSALLPIILWKVFVSAPNISLSSVG